MVDEAPYPYPRGVAYPAMPMPPIPEHCVSVDGGPLRFVIESRDLVADVERDKRPRHEPDQGDTVAFDDFGASLHVLGGGDGEERLRFDCFEHEPHYHYINHAEQTNLVCRIDEIAQGDPIAWTVGVVRTRLPEMLRFAGHDRLGDETSKQLPSVLDAVDQVALLLDRARLQTHAQRVAGGTSGTGKGPVP